MKRKIITIDEDLCNGCGDCISACAEGALQLVNGKAKLVKEQFCDGFGDCLGECPTGALKIAEMDVPDYDPMTTREHVARTGGQEAVKKFDEASQRHAVPSGGLPAGALAKAGCPGMAIRFNPKAGSTPKPAPASGPGQVIRSELEQWPVQIHLVRPDAPYFKNRELVILSTCSPIASADIHWRFIRGRAVVVGCPKLDNTDGYIEKLAAILSEPSIPRVIIVRMEIPCCGGLTAITRQAVEMSGRNDLVFEEVNVGLDGNIAVP